jgi:putative PIN family toxin of toxin-antitoxin system
VLKVLATKFMRDPEELAQVAVLLAELAEMVHPRRRVQFLKDEGDNRILECAMTGNADLIVTGDQAMLELRVFERVQFFSLRSYLDS